MMSWFSWGGGSGYNAIKKTGNRKTLSTSNGSHEIQLSDSERKKAVANTRDLRRNFIVVSWAVRKHLDYISDFKYKSKTDDTVLKAYMENKVKEWSKSKSFDQAGKVNLRKGLRLLESSRFLDGDVFSYKLRNGRLQFIEGDRVGDMKRPNETAKVDDLWVQGIKVNTKTGRRTAIRVGKRKGNRLEWLADIPTKNIIYLAYMERFDQERGVSPLMAAIQTFQDNAEGFDYSLQKLKIGQLMGMVFTRSADDGFAQTEAETTLIEDLEGVEDGAREGYEFDFGQSNMISADLEPGEDLKIIESANPANEVQSFLTLTIELAIKAFDFPTSFFDSTKANFAGSRSDDIAYKKSCSTKKEDLIEWLDEWIAYKIQHDILNGDTYLAENISNIKGEWVSTGTEWWDTLKQSKGAAAMIGMSLDNPERIAKELGTDIYENIDATARVMAYAEEKGVPFILAGVTGAGDTSDDEMQVKEDRK